MAPSHCSQPSLLRLVALLVTIALSALWILVKSPAVSSQGTPFKNFREPTGAPAGSYTGWHSVAGRQLAERNALGLPIGVWLARADRRNSGRIRAGECCRAK